MLEFAITVPVLILLANSLARHGPLIAEILMFLIPLIANIFFIFSLSIIIFPFDTESPFVNKIIYLDYGYVLYFFSRH